jgi:hypothetical protein
MKLRQQERGSTRVSAQETTKKLQEKKFNEEVQKALKEHQKEN